ncbi:hypothetical protein PTKIN_Ptkin08bG0151200 [Pterospermum kingtungense]
MGLSTMRILWILGMIFTQAVNIRVNTIYVMTYNIDYSLKILLAYRFFIAMLLGIEDSIDMEDSRTRGFRWCLRGALGQNLYAESFGIDIGFTTQVAAIISNLSPAITYVLALIFRMEIFSLATWRDRVNSTGNIIKHRF